MSISVIGQKKKRRGLDENKRTIPRLSPVLEICVGRFDGFFSRGSRSVPEVENRVSAGNVPNRDSLLTQIGHHRSRASPPQLPVTGVVGGGWPTRRTLSRVSKGRLAP